MTSVIAIGGPSASGKSTVARTLVEHLVDAVHLQQDLFFVAPEECEPHANFCDARYLHGRAFCQALARLAGGMDAVVPAIDFGTFRRVGSQTLLPRPVIVVEGMTVLRYPEVRKMCHLAYYLITPWSVIEKRKRSRDRVERGRSVEIIERQLQWIRQERARDLADITQPQPDGIRVKCLGGLNVVAEVESIIADLHALMRTGCEHAV